MVDIVLILFLIYFGYIGYQKGFVRQLSNMISYIFGLIIARFMFSLFSESLSIFIIQDRLRDKISYLISFIIIVYIFKILTKLIEALINLKWKNNLLSFILGAINGLIILSLIISIFKEIAPNSININNQSYIYQNIDVLQKEYLIQYKEVKN